MAYSVTLVQGLPSTTGRGLAFLESSNDPEVNGKTVFDALRAKKKLDVFSRFQLWLAGERCDKYFHGWPSDKARKNLFVFKWSDPGGNQRLYGFLCHPRPRALAFQACILVVHDQKEELTEESTLNVVRRFMTLIEVLRAVAQAFQEDAPVNPKRR